MLDVVSVENMRRSDEGTIAGGVPSRELMYRAGKGILESVGWRAPVAIVTGSGNNGGDGYVLAELLTERGIACKLFLLSERFSADGRYYFDRCVGRGIEYAICDGTEDLRAYGTVVDCIFGTGFRGDVEGLPRRVIERINASGAYVVSVDINSGMNGDSGRAVTAVRSDLTVSVGTRKSGHFLSAAKDLVGRLVNVDIGIAILDPPYHLVEEGDIRRVLTRRRRESNKSTYGYVALVGGSLMYSGAIRLASLAESAMRAGAGVTTVAAPASLAPVILPAILESTFYPLSDAEGTLVFSAEELDALMKRVRVIAFGMGIGNGDGTALAVEHLLRHYDGTLILDADGLNALARLPRTLLSESRARVILTPHPLEFARLTGKTVAEVLDAPIALARAYAEETGATVLLKGTCTVVTDGAEVYLVDRGCAGMATAGSGDVLSGILAALCGYSSEDPAFTAAAAAFLNGYAGELAEGESNAIAMTAGDTARKVKDAVVALSE